MVPDSHESLVNDLRVLDSQLRLMSSDDSVRMAVYDLNSDTFLGFKLDSGWRLDKSLYKNHSPHRAGLEGVLIKNLLSFLNSYPSPDSHPEIAWRIQVEPAYGASFDPIANYVVRKMKDGPQQGKYVAEIYNPKP